MAEIQRKGAFEKESKLFLSEFQKPDCFHSVNCTEHVGDVMKRHLDVLFVNCVKNYIHLCNTSSNYADMHDRYWAENLADFYELVRNSGEMDLKNQPEWQNSAFIFDSEIVSQDALGNINYGYFGKHCNFPDSVLIAAGGVAQFLAGTSEFENWYVFLDDPRDTYRVMQGIEIYEEDN